MSGSKDGLWRGGRGVGDRTAIWLVGDGIWHVLSSAYQWRSYSLSPKTSPPTCDASPSSFSSLSSSHLPPTQQEKTEVVRTKRKYEKKPKIPPQSAPHHAGPSVFNPKDLNQYDFPSSDDETFSQVKPSQENYLFF